MVVNGGENGSESSRSNPVDGSTLQHSSNDLAVQHPQKEILPGDSSTTQAEKIERHGTNGSQQDADFEQSQSKRRKLDQSSVTEDSRPYTKGIAPIKAEFLVPHASLVQHIDEDDAESARPNKDERAAGRGGKKTKGGQNTSRTFGSSRDQIELCKSRDQAGEFDPITCKFGDKCRLEHDIRKYLKDGKREDLQTFNGQCPVEEINGFCSAGWRCRFAGSHSQTIKRQDGREELVQVHSKENPAGDDDALHSVGVVNIVSYTDKIELRKKKFPLPQSDKYLAWLSTLPRDDDQANGKETAWTEPPLRASEKRRIYYGAETPILAPLTTQGNLPFRRLCVQLGAQVTWSEMAMGLPLVQGEKGEWALLKAHESEVSPPRYTPKGIVTGYNNLQDLKFGAQIAANKPWIALKTTEVLTKLCPNLRAIDLNCGCPIDLVFRQGAGSALLDTPGKLEKILRGMNLVSGEVPITVKIRMGTKDKQPTAEKLCQRLVLGGQEAQDQKEGPAGVAAITLHGRSRQQRYTRNADWSYIAECASLVKKLRSQRDEVTDTVRQADGQGLSASAVDGMPYFIGNGDVLSHVDYNEHIDKSGVDSVMIGRGALVKPWVFEEIAAGQYLDKSSSERLQYVEQFCKNGLEYWGSDEIGVGTTRRFLLEWLSFACRYVPLGILEHLPPRLGDRPPAFKGRDDMETLLSSANYKDWIKISEMYLGKAHENFHFEPKHKSNSYEIEAEG